MGLFDDINYGQVAGGLFSGGMGLFAENQKRKQMEEMIRQQSPNAATMATMGATSLGRAGSMDPAAFAKQRFEQQQQLMGGANAKSFADFQRSLAAKGMLGLATDNPGVEGIPAGTDPNARMNPQMAAFLAAQNAQRSKDAMASLNEGETQLDRLLKRGTGLSAAAQEERKAGIGNVRAAGVPPKRGFGDIALNIGGDLMKNSGLFGQIGEGFKSLFGGGRRFGDFTGGSEWAPFQRTDWSTGFGD